MKFKKVEIQAFKSYVNKDDGTFDFTVNNEPANLVSIYAPNGFGKTSFYDAIDYCITNNITRYIRDRSLAISNDKCAKNINQKGEKQYILRSRNAPDDLESIIKISTTVGDFTSNEINARSGSKDYSFDDSRTPDNVRYFRDVLLSQEAIDSFLREEKAEERYKSFMEYQLGGDDSLEVNRKKIFCLINELSNKKDKIQSEITKLNNIEVLLDDTIVEKSNSIIKDVNSYGYKLSEIDDNFDSNNYEPYIINLNTIETELNNKKINLDINRNKFLNHINKIDETESKFKKINENKVEIQKNIKTENTINEFNESKKNRDGILRELDTNNKNLSIYTKANDNLDNFNIIRSNDLKNTKDIIKQREEIEKTKNNIEKINNNIKYYEFNRIKSVNDLKNNNDNLEAIPSVYYKLETLRAEVQKLNLSEQEKNIEVNKHKQKELENDISNLKKFDISSDDILFLSHFNPEFTSLKSQYNETNIKLIKQTDILNKLKVQLNDLSKLDDKISQLIVLGSTIINQSKEHLTNCPLCNSKHADLLSEINNNNFLEQSQKDLIENVSLQERIKIYLENEIIRIKTDVFNLRISTIDNLNIKLSNLAIIITEENIKLLQDNTTLSTYNNDINKLLSITKNKDKNDLFIDISNAILQIKKEIKKFDDNISNLKNEKLKLNNELNKKEIELSSLLSLLKKDDSDNVYNNYKNIISQTSIPISLIENDIDIENLRSNIQLNLIKHKNSNIELNSSLQKLNDKIEKIKNQLNINSSSDIKLLCTTINLSKNDLMNENAYLLSSTREFYELCREMQVDNDLNENNWNLIVNKLEKSLSEYDKKLKDLDLLLLDIMSLKSILSDITEYLDYKKSKELHEELTDNINDIDTILHPLIEDLENINKTLKLQVDDYFHTELINKIYSKIDPHPEFKRVKFDCSFHDNGRPTLNVYLVTREGRDMISPTLNLSSAQVNVLSLSIFLAKALNAVDNDGNPVHCIFIDDPVQSMDSINVLATIDLLRNISINMDKQIIISTHDENFHSLLKRKIPVNIFNSKYIELESYGKVKHDR